jgi:hypothetical protein
LLKKFLKIRKSYKFIFFSIILVVFFLFVVQIGTHTLGLTQPRSWEYIHLFEDGFCSFSYAVQGDKEDNYQVTINITGLSVYANLILSYLVDSGTRTKTDVTNIYNTYWIYPQKIDISYQGYVKGESIYDGPDMYREDKVYKSWNFSKSFTLPLPDEDMNHNEIEAWRSQIRKIEQANNCKALIVIRDQRPIGGKVEIFPHFFVNTKGIGRQIVKGYHKRTGRKIDVNRAFEPQCPLTFNSSRQTNQIDEYIYASPDGILQTDSFSLERFSCSNQGNGRYVPNYYKTHSRVAYTTVLSDSEHVISWSYMLSLGKPVKAKIEWCPENWRPQGGDLSNTVEIKAYLENEGEGIFRFILFEVSKEKGVALNKGAGVEFDYEFGKNQPGFRKAVQTEDGWVIETKSRQKEAQVIIRSQDFGAWARLKAQVKIGDSWFDCQTDNGQTYITIPYDQDEDHIADFWEKKHDVYNEQANADNDLKPEDVGDPAEPGDGYSNYEEYRGFFVNGSWTDTDPTYKDIFIYDELGFGVGYFTDLGLCVHLIDQDEFDQDRYVNFNRGYGTLKSQEGQKGLHLRGGFVEGSLGYTEGLGCPNVVGPITVDCLSIWNNATFEVMGKTSNMYNWREIDREDIPQAKGTVVGPHLGTYYDVTISNAPIEINAAIEKVFLHTLQQIIAHELGHGVNITHHGHDNEIINKTPDLRSYLENYSSNDPALLYSEGSTAIAGGIWSGDVSCVMRYLPPLNYLGWDNKIYLYPEDEGEEARTIYCSSKKGTGINSPPRRWENGRPYPVAGDATKGECRKMVDLKGTHYGGH